MDSPQRVREHAMSDACAAVKNAKLKFKTTKEFQQVSFRTKRDTVQGFGFDAQSLKEDVVFSNKLYRSGFYATETIQTTLEGTRIVIEDDRYFVIVPTRINVKSPETQRCKHVALDPGIRTFMTFYSAESHGKIGSGDFNNIFRLCYALDQLQARISKAKCKQKRNMRKASARLRWKIYNMIEELHKKTAHFLVTRFETVFIPTFETSQMVTKLRFKTARSMLTFAFFRFKSFLKAKGQEYSCNVIEVSEAYTSKTCSYCGTMHKIGSKKVMKCCAEVDRDYNGARGIYLASLVGSHPTTIVGNC
jgi:putative transposase